MKSKTLIILTISALILVLTVVMDYRLNIISDYNRVNISEDEYLSLMSSHGLSDTPLITDVYVDEQKLIYDVADNTFYCSKIDEVDFNTISTKKNPTNSIFEVIGLDIIQIGITDNNQLIMYNHDKISVSDYIVSSLPFINITVSADTVKDLGLDESYQIDSYTGAELTLYDNRKDFDGISREINSDIKLHVRGGTTTGLPQKSYRITLIEDKNNIDSENKNENLLGLREDDDWILYSAYSDYEKVRNVFSMNLWNATSKANNEWQVDACNEYVYVEAFFNNRYHGLYALSYPIDSKQLNRQEDESIIQKKDWTPSEYALDVEYNENLGYDWIAGYYLQKGSPDAYYLIHDLLYAMSHSEDNDTIRTTVDMNNAIDLYLFYELSQASDNIYDSKVKNLFIINKPANNEFGYKLLLIPWDMDQTWGNRYVDGEGRHAISSYDMSYDYELPINWGPVPFLIANGDETIVDEVQSRYQELRKSSWSNESIMAMLDSYEKDIYDSGAYERTLRRWPDENSYDIDVKLGDFKEFVVKRLEWMDKYVSELK